MCDQAKSRLKPRADVTFKLRANPLAPLLSVADVPCFCCLDIDRCVRGTNLHPNSCQKLDGWLGIANRAAG